MADEKDNQVTKSFLDSLSKVGIYVKATRASDNFDSQTDANGAGKGLGRFYPSLDGNNTIGDLRAAVKSHCYTKGEDYIFYVKNTQTVAINSQLLKDIAIDESKENDDQTKFTINAKKQYPKEEPGETGDAASKLIEEVTELDTKAYYAVGSIDGCQVVLDNILKLLDTIFKDVNNDPLLQTLVSIAKHDNTADKETVKQNQIELKKLLLEMNAYKKSELEKVLQALSMVISSLMVLEGLKWGTKKVYNRVTKNRAVYQGPQTKWQSRYSGIKKWGAGALKGAMKFAGVAAQVATIGLTIYGIAAEAEMRKEHWRKVCQQLIDQKSKRYDDYEDIYSRYNDLSETMWMLRNQFVTNFKEQCTKQLLEDFGDKAPTIASMQTDNDKVLKSLISEVMGSLTNIQKYLYGLVKEFTQVSTSMKFIKKFMGGDSTVKSVKGYDAFISSVEEDEDKPVTLNDKEKARYTDIYVLYLLDKYYQVLDESGLDKILGYDKDLREIVGEFPKNDNSMFGAKDAPLKEYIQQMRMTYLYFDGANQNSSSTSTENKARVTFEFTEKVQKLYDESNKSGQ